MPEALLKLVLDSLSANGGEKIEIESTECIRSLLGDPKTLGDCEPDSPKDPKGILLDALLGVAHEPESPLPDVRDATMGIDKLSRPKVSGDGIHREVSAGQVIEDVAGLNVLGVTTVETPPLFSAEHEVGRGMPMEGMMFREVCPDGKEVGSLHEDLETIIHEKLSHSIEARRLDGEIDILGGNPHDGVSDASPDLEKLDGVHERHSIRLDITLSTTSPGFRIPPSWCMAAT